MPAIWWMPILAKAISTALVVVIASALAETLGPFWGGLIACLPVSAGPAYVFLAMQHDSGFIAASALSSLAANAAAGAFLIVYAMRAARSSLWRGLGMALATWLLASLLIRSVAWSPATAILLNLVIYGAGFVVAKGPFGAPARPANVPARTWHDLPLRAAAIALFVTGLVLASALLGPDATGIAAVFPISLTSVIIISRRRIGGAASALLAATALRAMPGFGLALLTLHLAARPWGSPTALLLALCATLLWSGGLLVWQSRFRTGRSFKCRPDSAQLPPSVEQ